MVHFSSVTLKKELSEVFYIKNTSDFDILQCYYTKKCSSTS